MEEIQEQLEDLVREHGTTLLAFTIAICKRYGKNDRDYALDHLQDCYLKFYEKRDYYSDLDKLEQLRYMYSMIRNLLIDKIRREKKITYNSEMINDRNLHLESKDHFAFEESDLLATIMKTLNLEQQFIFELYLQGYKYDEIAEKSGLQKSTVGVMIYRIKKNLQDRFGHLR